jgi:CDGSH iron-sulfur domain-containing protein 3
MSKTIITVRDNGPLRLQGEFEIVDADGNVFPNKPTVSLCRCGLSKNKPYCDGSHKGEFENIVRAISE